MTNEILQEISSFTTDGEVLSLYVDMSVTSDNKRTWQTFLNKQRSRFPALDSDRPGHHREHVGEILTRAETWLATQFDTRCKGAVIFAEIGGDRFDAFSFPRPLPNRLDIGPQPVVGPLHAAMGTERRWCVAIVDREHLRVLTVHLGKIEADNVIEPEPYPTPHDVQAGGYAHKDYQKWKAEEARSFFKTFAEEVAKVGAQYSVDGYVLLGTSENTKHFLEFLSPQIQERVVHTGHAPPAGNSGDLLRRLEPLFADITAREEARAIEQLLDRVRNDHLAASGWHQTLIELQEGKVDQLFIARNEAREGVQCTQCSFYLVRREGECPYCGGTLRDGIDLVESAVRMAAGQEVRVEFVASDALSEMNGVGALLKFR
jgi:hypothetical protein